MKQQEPEPYGPQAEALIRAQPLNPYVVLELRPMKRLPQLSGNYSAVAQEKEQSQ